MAHPLLSKINFAVGRNPRIERRKDWRRFIPEPYAAVVLLQADFEMAWAWQWSKQLAGDKRQLLEIARRERGNIPAILDLCDKYEIPLTWATVGHLLLDHCQRGPVGIHPEIPRPEPFENEFWKYSGGDWFVHDPGTDIRRDPEWYAADLVREILARKTRHEIGCHTFSHIDCRDGVCSTETMNKEIDECKKIARQWGIPLRSFVHPGNMIGGLKVISEQGFTSFRSDYQNVLGYPKQMANGLWEIKQTAEIIHRKEWSIDYHIKRYTGILKRAIRNNSVCVLWFHPSFNDIVVDKILSQIFRFICDHREIYVCPTGGYISWLSVMTKYEKI